MTRQYNNNDGRDQVNIEHFYQSPQPPRPRNEWLLLQAVNREVRSRLDQSLHHAVLIALDKQTQPERVKRSLDAEIKSGSKPSEPLLPGISILQVFEREDIAGQLLILGEPGSGKTTTMLDLARDLVQRAETNINYPIPVLLNLSSWQNPRQAMKDWLVEELKSKYGVRKDIGRKWLEDRKLLPLLDGLDEVKQKYQVSCVRAINSWLQSEFRPLYVVVCSRREEYEKVIQGRWQEADNLEFSDLEEEISLHLDGAILLQALNEQQIQDYLTTINREDLWQKISSNHSLLELARTPLLLHIIVLAYQEIFMDSVGAVNRTSSLSSFSLQDLLDAYVQRMLCRSVKSRAYKKYKPPSVKRTRKWLAYLAKQLHQESKTEFLIEKMQPSWLVTGKQEKAYRWVISLTYGLCGLI